MMHEIKMTTSTIMRKWVAQRTDTERTNCLSILSLLTSSPFKRISHLCILTKQEVNFVLSVTICDLLLQPFFPLFFSPSSPLFKHISKIRNSDWRRKTYKSQPNFELASRQRGKLTASCHFSLSVGENFIISTVFS